MKATYNIITNYPDVRTLKTFSVEGKTAEECWELAQQELIKFIDSLDLDLQEMNRTRKEQLAIASEVLRRRTQQT